MIQLAPEEAARVIAYLRAYSDTLSASSIVAERNSRPDIAEQAAVECFEVGALTNMLELRVKRSAN